MHFSYNRSPSTERNDVLPIQLGRRFTHSTMTMLYPSNYDDALPIQPWQCFTKLLKLMNYSWLHTSSATVVIIITDTQACYIDSGVYFC